MDETFEGGDLISSDWLECFHSGKCWRRDWIITECQTQSSSQIKTFIVRFVIDTFVGGDVLHQGHGGTRESREGEKGGQRRRKLVQCYRLQEEDLQCYQGNEWITKCVSRNHVEIGANGNNLIYCYTIDTNLDQLFTGVSRGGGNSKLWSIRISAVRDMVNIMDLLYIFSETLNLLVQFICEWCWLCVFDGWVCCNSEFRIIRSWRELPMSYYMIAAGLSTRSLPWADWASTIRGYCWCKNSPNLASCLDKTESNWRRLNSMAVTRHIVNTENIGMIEIVDSHRVVEHVRRSWRSGSWRQGCRRWDTMKLT